MKPAEVRWAAYWKQNRESGGGPSLQHVPATAAPGWGEGLTALPPQEKARRNLITECQMLKQKKAKRDIKWTQRMMQHKGWRRGDSRNKREM